MNKKFIGVLVVIGFYLIILLSSFTEAPEGVEPKEGAETTEATKDVEAVETNDNEKCLKCHANNYYSFHNEVIEKDVHKKMNPFFLINKGLYDNGVHNTFNCTDCHVEEYETYPHDSELKLEANYGCIDCHGDDDDYAKFHFDEINIQVQASIHGEVFKDDFKCEMCHNPHYYQLEARNKTDIKEIVKQSNQMCLNCHEYTEDRFYLLTDTNMSINENSHKWLPNQSLHFDKVRCIDCHSSHNDTISLSHDILGKETAVKNCVECHSTNSKLMSTLYQHKAKEKRDKLGFFNGVMLGDSFVIGANNNYYLNVASISIFSILILILLIHAILRIILKK